MSCLCKNSKKKENIKFTKLFLRTSDNKDIKKSKKI